MFFAQWYSKVMCSILLFPFFFLKFEQLLKYELWVSVQLYICLWVRISHFWNIRIFSQKKWRYYPMRQMFLLIKYSCFSIWDKIQKDKMVVFIKLSKFNKFQIIFWDAQKTFKRFHLNFLRLSMRNHLFFGLVSHIF